MQYLRSFYFGAGEGEAIKAFEYSKSSLFSRPKWVWRLAIESEMRYRCTAFLANQQCGLNISKMPATGGSICACLLYALITADS